MTNNMSEYIYLDGMWLKGEQLLKLAMNVGNYAQAEHYLGYYNAAVAMLRELPENSQKLP